MNIKIGDVVEICTRQGRAYAIYTHLHPVYGALLRVFDQLRPVRPFEIADITRSAIRFSVFFPLQAAIENEIVEIVGNVSIPDELKAFPTFRAGMVNPISKQVDKWWLWDGENEWEVGDLTEETRRLPIRGVWNDTLLINRIENGWRPENDAR
jgi:hypothetical protein